MVSNPTEVPGLLVDRAMEICGAVAGGISIYEEPGEVFRWHDLRGTLERFAGETTPRNNSPCGIALDEKSAVLVQSPERAYSWLAEKNVSIPECLLVPLYARGGSEPLGTLWMVSDQVGHFNLGDAESLEQIAAFTGMSLQMIRSAQSLKSALERQELLTREMGHRIKNLIAITDAMLRIGAKDASTKEELTATLSSRLHALAAANAIIHSREEALHACNLSDFLGLVLKPYSQAIAKLDGPELQIGDQAINNVALIFHEMATNAAKYGALSNQFGTIALTWNNEADQINAQCT
jgi:two-component sensor histidine kinase